jgi:hypothetical protein
MTTTTSNALIGSNTLTNNNAALLSVDGPFFQWSGLNVAWCSFQLPVTSVVSQFDVQISLGIYSPYHLYLHEGIGQGGTLLATSQGVPSLGSQYYDKVSFIIPSTTLTANTYYTFAVGVGLLSFLQVIPPAFAASWPTNILFGGTYYVLPYDIYAYPTSIPNNPSGSSTLYTDGLSNLQVVNPISSYNLCVFQEIVFAASIFWTFGDGSTPTTFDGIFVNVNHSFGADGIFTPPVNGRYTVSISIPCINPNVNGNVYILVRSSPSTSYYQIIGCPIDTTIPSPTLVLGGSVTMYMATNTPVTFDLISPVPLQPLGVDGQDLHANYPCLHIYRVG